MERESMNVKDDSRSPGYGKIGVSILAAFSASYLMNFFSIHGVDFEALGFPSELVKSTAIGALVGFFTWITPHNIMRSLIDLILFVRLSCRQFRDAANKPLDELANDNKGEENE